MLGDNGGDGSGRHAKFRNSKSDNENLILGGFRQISLKCHCGCGLIVYKEKSLGPETEVPYFLIPGKETRDTVQAIVTKMKPEMVMTSTIH